MASGCYSSEAIGSCHSEGDAVAPEEAAFVVRQSHSRSLAHARDDKPPAARAASASCSSIATRNLNSSASSVDSHRCRSPLRGAPRQPYGRLGLLLFHRDVKPQLVGLERRLTSLPIPAARGPSSAARAATCPAAHRRSSRCAPISRCHRSRIFRTPPLSSSSPPRPASPNRRARRSGW